MPVIRTARSADLPVVGRLAAEMVRLHHGFDPQRFMLPRGTGSLEEGYARFLQGELQDSRAVVLVALVDEEIVGYAYGRLEGRSWQSLLDRAGWLHDIFVDEARRRLGIASTLVEEMASRLKAIGAPRLVLTVAEKNPGAQALFARAGFRRTMVEMTRELDDDPGDGGQGT